ncbi:hypothetical protein ILYODFUR_008694 [Ilyodon furcidens]|uniref:Uncharacterized protein n=1 Tax=Ilyodon furcidens TaxID=33524 RepID=A0ABV0UU24_9TELE
MRLDNKLNAMQLQTAPADSSTAGHTNNSLFGRRKATTTTAQPNPAVLLNGTPITTSRYKPATLLKTPLGLKQTPLQSNKNKDSLFKHNVHLCTFSNEHRKDDVQRRDLNK